MTREEAIEVYNGLINTKIKEAFEFFAPELAESEDERIRKELIQYLKDNPNLPKGNYCRNDFFSWLEKQGEQKLAWSKEDEKKRTLLISILEVNHPNGCFKVNPANTLNMEATHTEELVDWLKSLSPQNRWKPSEEQMFALLCKLPTVRGSSKYKNDILLESLYNDLKKL